MKEVILLNNNYIPYPPQCDSLYNNHVMQCTFCHPIDSTGKSYSNCTSKLNINKALAKSQINTG